jgi:hypothetical protein
MDCRLASEKAGNFAMLRYYLERLDSAANELNTLIGTMLLPSIDKTIESIERFNECLFDKANHCGVR